MFKKRGQVKCKFGQVWVETVLYTLIGLSIIGLLLAFVKPKIEQITDKAILSQTIESLNTLNEQVISTLVASGNQREIELIVKKGEYVIDPLNDSLYFILKDTRYKYSDPGISFLQGEIITLTTEKSNSRYDVLLMLDYNSFNLTYYGKEQIKFVSNAPTPYHFLIQNKGNRQINIEPV